MFSSVFCPLDCLDPAAHRHICVYRQLHHTHTLERDQFGQVFFVQRQQVEPLPQQDAPLLQDSQSDHIRKRHARRRLQIFVVSQS